MNLGTFYRAHVHQLRAALAFIGVVAGQVVQAGPDVMATWSARRVLVGIAVAAVSAAVPLLMKSSPPAPGAQP